MKLPLSVLCLVFLLLKCPLGMASDGAWPSNIEPTELNPDLPSRAKIVDCYDSARIYLEKICEDYRRIRAAELSQERDIPFEEAYLNVQSVMPVLKPINREILTKRITNPDDIDAHKREVEKVEAEVGNMVELAKRLLLEIEQRQTVVPVATIEILEPASEATEITTQQVQDENQESQPTKTTEATRSNIELERLLVDKARESREHRAVDIAQEMRALQGSSFSNASHQAIEGSFASAAEMNDLKINTRNMDYDFARIVKSTGGQKMQWMFIDTWYTIGPFPNPKRININTKFPPETVVNLSATYTGKDNKEVRWEFLQSGILKTSPNHPEEYAIYYAYTELWFDEDQDLWIAIGSDDKANLWINDLPVWISGDELKSWRVDEGYRKVFFKKGVNRILYRVENGWSGVYFSLGIQMVP